MLISSSTTKLWCQLIGFHHKLIIASYDKFLIILKFKLYLFYQIVFILKYYVDFD